MLAEDNSWELKLTPGVEKTKANSTTNTPSYNSNFLNTAIGYNINGDQIELSMGTTQSRSPINETVSSL